MIVRKSTNHNIRCNPMIFQQKKKKKYFSPSNNYNDDFNYYYNFFVAPILVVTILFTCCGQTRGIALRKTNHGTNRNSNTRWSRRYNKQDHDHQQQLQAAIKTSTTSTLTQQQHPPPQLLLPLPPLNHEILLQRHQQDQVFVRKLENDSIEETTTIRCIGMNITDTETVETANVNNAVVSTTIVVRDTVVADDMDKEAPLDLVDTTTTTTSDPVTENTTTVGSGSLFDLEDDLLKDLSIQRVRIAPFEVILQPIMAPPLSSRDVDIILTVLEIIIQSYLNDEKQSAYPLNTTLDFVRIGNVRSDNVNANATTTTTTTEEQSVDSIVNNITSTTNDTTQNTNASYVGAAILYIDNGIASFRKGEFIAGNEVWNVTTSYLTTGEKIGNSNSTTTSTIPSRLEVQQLVGQIPPQPQNPYDVNLWIREALSGTDLIDSIQRLPSNGENVLLSSYYTKDDVVSENLLGIKSVRYHFTELAVPPTGTISTPNSGTAAGTTGGVNDPNNIENISNASTSNNNGSSKDTVLIFGCAVLIFVIISIMTMIAIRNRRRQQLLNSPREEMIEVENIDDINGTSKRNSINNNNQQKRKSLTFSDGGIGSKHRKNSISHHSRDNSNDNNSSHDGQNSSQLTDSNGAAWCGNSTDSCGGNSVYTSSAVTVTRSNTKSNQQQQHQMKYYASGKHGSPTNPGNLPPKSPLLSQISLGRRSYSFDRKYLKRSSSEEYGRHDNNHNGIVSLSSSSSAMNYSMKEHSSSEGGWSIPTEDGDTMTLKPIPDLGHAGIIVPSGNAAGGKLAGQVPTTWNSDRQYPLGASTASGVYNDDKNPLYTGPHRSLSAPHLLLPEASTTTSTSGSSMMLHNLGMPTVESFEIAHRPVSVVRKDILQTTWYNKNANSNPFLTMNNNNQKNHNNNNNSNASHLSPGTSGNSSTPTSQTITPKVNNTAITTPITLNTLQQQNQMNLSVLEPSYFTASEENAARSIAIVRQSKDDDNLMTEVLMNQQEQHQPGIAGSGGSNFTAVVGVVPSSPVNTHNNATTTYNNNHSNSNLNMGANDDDDQVDPSFGISNTTSASTNSRNIEDDDDDDEDDEEEEDTETEDDSTLAENENDDNDNPSMVLDHSQVEIL